MEGLEQTGKLLGLIRERGFKPGDKLPSERDLAALFGMSRSAVREALIRLDTLRIVESRPKSGVYLQPYGAERSIEPDERLANCAAAHAEQRREVALRGQLVAGLESTLADQLEQLAGLLKTFHRFTRSCDSG